MLVRVVNVDFYMNPPISNLDPLYSEFRGSATHQVPILRIFGSTDTGVKTCLHVHGVFPYIYIPYDGSEGAESFMYQLATSLDKAINVSLGQTSSNMQHIFKITLVSGIPFYGYHPKHHQFLKLYFYNPLILKKACALLQNGSIMGRIFQPHEAHIPYILQFMIDYNLYGMSFINISEVKYRNSIDLIDIPEELILPSTIQKMSTCKLEIDGLAENILNRLEVNSQSLGLNPGIQALWDDEKQRRRNVGDNSLVEHCLTQNRTDIEPTATHLAYLNALKEKLRKPAKNEDEDKQNLSVYPAETPKDNTKKILNASTIESHIYSSQSSDSTFLDFTITPEENEANLSLDRDAMELLEVLGDLRENVESDSILSQALPERESDDEEKEEDLSVPLPYVQTPVKSGGENLDQNESDLDECYFDLSISIPQLDGADDLTPTKRGRKTTGVECHAIGADIPKYPVNQYDHFDGTNDSSSSDDDIITTVKKITKHIASQSTSKYAPLKVKYTSPTKSVGKSALSRNRSQDKISNVKALTQSTLTTNKSKQSLYKHRRKLSFTQSFETKSNTTQIEEHLSCRLKARRSSKVNEKVYIDCDLSNSSSSSSCNSIGSEREVLPIQLCQTNLDQDESLENDVNEIIEKTDFRDRADYEDISLDDTLTPKKNDSSLSDDLFSPESDEIIICRKIDPAKQYDVENKFIPLAGSSKMDPQFKKISQHSNNSSSSDVITPYQREQNIIIEDVIESVVANNFSENSETSQEYNVDKTGNETISSLHMNTDSVNEIISGRFEKLNTSMLSVYKPTSQNLIKNDETSLKITPKFNPPSREMVETSLESYDIPEVTNQEPFYSDRNDVTGSIEVGRKVLKIPSNNVFDLSTFKTDFEGIESQKKKTLEVLEVDNKKLSAKEILEYKLSTSNNSDVVVTPGKIPPNRKEVGKWLKGKVNKKDVEEEKGKEKKRIFLVNSPGRDGEESCDSLSLSPCTPIDANSTIFKLDLDNDQKCSQNLPKSEPSKSNDTVIKNLSSSTPSNSHEITGTTQANFLVASHNLNEAKAVKENLYLTILSIEVIAITRNEYKPNPELDQIKAIIFTLCDNDNISKGGFIINTLPISPTKTKSSILKGIDSRYNLKPVNTELELINEFVEFVKEKDPDIFVGFEIEMLSWGYLIDRGYVLGLNLTILLSKIPDIPRKKRDDEELAITGRILLDFWRLLRHEIALTSYSFENIVYHILHRRIPLYSHKDLTNWLQHPTAVYRNRVIEYYSYKTRAVLQIMDQLDLIGRTSELAKLFGIQFYEVLSRGSQFRVESMMLRLAKPLNFIPVSPNQQQRAKMRAPESLPLIMEPESKFYTDPVIVLDFQSLYPSMIIAYNYCFSTCLGRIEHLGKSSPFEFGANQLKVSKKYLKYFLNKGKLNISPCGIAFVNKSIRSGILPRMLQEILDTRLMVKKSLKQNAQNKVLSKVLDARQLGLKLIANVTYGYTAANFSGRMPCIELGDSVVSKGRETLQRAIQLVEKTSKWGAKVVYGDTDSLFVLIPGKSKESAFKIGAEIAEAVTNSNPSPVKLKLEKIFQPCILQTKKRYVGYMYESVDQKEPEFLAKGIETVRRDGCPASAKMLEKCLKLLFDTRDVSLIKKYVLRQFAKLLSGRVSIQDLTFAKEYRGASYYRPGACVPALELAKKWTSIDKRNEPRKGERVPYVIINGPPGQPLIKLVKSPRDVLNDSSIRINALYYITKAIIPPLNRCFLLIGADLNQWFNEMPRKQHQYLPTASSSPGKNKTKKTTITQFFSTLDCAICGALTQDGLCEKCKNNPQQSALLLHEKVRLWEQNFFNALQICQSCCGRPDEICCVSLDCPVYYRRIQTNRDLQQSGFIRQILLMLPNLEF